MRRIAMGLVLGAAAFVSPARADDPAAKMPVQVQRSPGGGGERAMMKSTGIVRKEELKAVSTSGQLKDPRNQARPKPDQPKGR